MAQRWSHLNHLSAQTKVAIEMQMPHFAQCLILLNASFCSMPHFAQCLILLNASFRSMLSSKLSQQPGPALKKLAMFSFLDSFSFTHSYLSSYVI